MDAQENETMTRVGPGTPAGETLRRYRLPIRFSDEIKTDEPKIVRLLAEDKANQTSRSSMMKIRKHTPLI